MEFRAVLLRLLAGAAVFMAACAGPSRYYRANLNAKLAAFDYTGALAELETAKKSEYGGKNSVLFYLDRGMILHNAANYAASDKDFEYAENRMEELFTKSVSRSAGTFLLNDNTTIYSGEVFERALVNVFRALNFLFLGGADDALVEARKVTAYLARLNEYMQGKSGFADSAFAQYLSAMLFEADGNRDDARIAYDAAAAAFRRYRADYGMPEPNFNIPSFPKLKNQGLGEIVFLHYAGPAPMKISRTFQVAWNDAMIAINQSGGEESDVAQVNNALRAGILGDAVTVAYPEYVQDPYIVTGSRVRAGDAEAESWMVENIAAIARQTLAAKNSAIYTRAVARAAIKSILAKAAAKEVEKKAGEGWGLLAKLVTGVTAAATEVADTRGWTTLPAQIRLARLAVPPGQHDVTVTCTRSNGSTDGVIVFKDILVEKGKRTFLHYRTVR